LEDDLTWIFFLQVWGSEAFSALGRVGKRWMAKHKNSGTDLGFIKTNLATKGNSPARKFVICVFLPEHQKGREQGETVGTVKLDGQKPQFVLSSQLVAARFFLAVVSVN